MTECWSIGGRRSSLYTDDRLFARVLRDEFSVYTEYWKDGRCVAWQFNVRSKSIPFLLRKHGLNLPALHRDPELANYRREENEGVTGIEIAENDTGGPEVVVEHPKVLRRETRGSQLKFREETF